MQDIAGIEVVESESPTAWAAWDSAVERRDQLQLAPIEESEEQRNARLLSSPYVLSLKNAAERRCAEAERVRADLSINRMKTSGQMLADEIHRAHLRELNEGVHA